jgi:uncharacterized membrane-anchored protein YitT (DUF2179 family)
MIFNLKKKQPEKKLPLLYSVFKWDLKTLIKATAGVFIFSLAINLFIAPNNLYNGGILGISQLIRTILTKKFHLKFGFDISGLINFIINVPLFILAYRKISKTFFYRTLYCVAIETLFLTIIPSPSHIIVEELITSVLIGGILAGVGVGITLSCSASSGGTDILGIIGAMKDRRLTVGNVGLTFNALVYSLSGILFGYKIMIYSIIYSVFTTIMIDKMHDQNISSTAFVFTKQKPKKIIDFVKDELQRDVTYWDAKGAYKHDRTYVCYIVLSKYELQRLERNLPTLDSNAFIVKSYGVGIYGKFEKKL